MRLDPQIIAQQIEQLILLYPELADDEQLHADMIEGETDAFDFIRLVENMRREATMMAGGIAGTIAELEVRQTRYTRKEQAMRALAFKIMQRADLRKVELPEATYSVRNGIAKVLVTDETQLPDDCVKVTRAPDKTAIKDKLSSGQTVPGAELSNAEPSLSIRTK